MTIIIGADAHGVELKEVIRQHLTSLGKEIIDLTDTSKDFVDNTLAIVAKVNQKEDNLGIMVDAYGVGPFMVATKVKGMIAAEVSDERSAYMTRAHNNARMITLGSEIVGPGVAKHIVEGFVDGTYDAGRHQIRGDMLNKMC